MGDKSKIEWTDATWNPVVGCSKVSEGCRRCYAMRTAYRCAALGQKQYVGLTQIVNKKPEWTGEVRLVEHMLSQPLRWKSTRNIFVNSMSDLFHEALDFRAIASVFGIMAAAPQHTFQILTKRPQRMLEFFQSLQKGDLATAIEVRTVTLAAAQILKEAFGKYAGPGARGEIAWPLRNVWLGTSVEDQATANERIPLLLQTPAAVRWISAEPLLGPITLTSLDIKQHFLNWLPRAEAMRVVNNDHYPKVFPLNALTGWNPGGDPFASLDWVVVGGESGNEARPMHPDWARSIRDECQRAEIPFFFKQWGEWNGNSQRIGKKAAGRVLDGSEWNEFPST